MEKMDIITIGGLPGAGKSTVRNIVADTLGFKTFSTGDFARSLAMKQGMTLAEFNENTAHNKNIDLEIDAELIRLAEEGKDMVVDSILGFHFIPRAFHVYLTISLEASADRIFNDKNAVTRVQTGDVSETREAMQEQIEARIKNHQGRYQDHYGVDPYDETLYDLVINTEHEPAAVVAERIVNAYRTWRGA